MVIQVKEKEFELFASLIPKDMQEDVRSGEWFCLGALFEPEDGDGEEHTAAGVLIFAVEDGINFEEKPVTMIVIKWLYVSENFRERGLADELMQELSDILDDNPAEGIICDVPFGSEYDLAEAFFTSWGFQFEVIEDGVMIITKEDCRAQISSADKEEALSLNAARVKPAGLISVQDIPEDIFREAVRAAKKAESSGYYDLISEEKEDYAADVSYCCMDGDKVSSLILFEKLPGEELHMVLLSSLSPSGARELLTLLHYAAGYYYINYPETATVRLTLGNEKSWNLANRIFPDKDTTPLRRGFFS